jgi:hypothetical protein
VITLFNLVTALAAEIADIIESGNFDTGAAELDYANRTPTNSINKSNIKLGYHLRSTPLCRPPIRTHRSFSGLQLKDNFSLNNLA